MDTPGNLLKTEREKQKKSLADIEKALKINIEYLRAIEKDNYQLLPADVFTKSYLRSYSKTLGLEDNHILGLYKKQFGKPSVIEPEADEHSPRKIKFNYIHLVIICIVMATVSVTAYIKHRTEKPAAAVPAKVHANIAITNNTKVPEPVREALPVKELTLEIAASELTWVSIKIDSGIAEELLLRARKSMTVTAHEKFVLKIGNAGGTSLILNGTDIGNLGPHGQIVDITLP